MINSRALILLALIWLFASLIVATTARAEPKVTEETADYGLIPPPNDRLFTQIEGNLKIVTAVPSAAEAKEIFGYSLYKKNIQPIWVSVENLSDEDMWLFPVGIDPAHYTPLETASRHYPWKLLQDIEIDADYSRRRMAMAIPPGKVQSGYIFSRVDEGTKSFNVDVVQQNDDPYRMTFFVPVPGLRLDHYEIEFSELYAEDEFVDVDRAGLIAGLESLPCCVRDGKDKAYGDPLNIAFIGEIDDMYYSFLRAGWDETETVYTSSLVRMVKSSLGGSEYRYSPVSPLYVFGRAQDAALQRARDNINQRNHLRIWLTPMRYEGKPVWIGQISRDIGVRFTSKTITTHKIDADVDETREFLIEDLLYSQGLARIGYVGGVGAAPFDEPRSNLTGDPYFTDGLRAVMWVSDSPIGIDELELVDLGGKPDWGPETPD